ncbi:MULTISPECIES: transketolase family protein [unclassified Siphonobacter]|uniref:transketolase family protein n=1 Tax=unclassified Siphonobacter TaxID=2635712 RepID=UPI002783CF7E|nr:MULTISPECIES: transketolase family protein [unclassified Siphonobacter]MDQ1088512.1 transketolase [Siphonobacter sp. SORGH_AS_1065]MDR6194660.1 transketolase [Siphonobacter sp. SORGH_AS_0500]
MKQYPYTDKKDTRSGFGAGMTELGRTNPDVVTLCADLVGSLKIDTFIQENPERFFQCGISEANMIGVSAGLAITGKIPFATTFANFGSSRVFDQVRQSVAYSNKNVKIAVSHAGLTLGEDGATHQVLEDLAMMKALPNMTVINPCDYNQTKAATIASANYEGPVYLRFGRPVIPVFIPEDMPFEIGKAITLNEGTDVSIFATGHLVWEALQACQLLEDEGISAEIINIHTIKPLDTEAILASVKKTGCCVSAEEHQINGGLGESIAHTLITNYLAPQEFIGVKDTFGESGTPDELMEKYGLKAASIVEAAKKAIARKSK